MSKYILTYLDFKSLSSYSRTWLHLFFTIVGSSFPARFSGASPYISRAQLRSLIVRSKLFRCSFANIFIIVFFTATSYIFWAHELCLPFEVENLYMKILLMLEKRWTGQLLIKMRETYSCCQLYNDINRCNCSFAPPLIRDMPGSVLVFISRWYPGMLSTCLRDKTFVMESFVWKCFFQWRIVMFTSIIGRF